MENMNNEQPDINEQEYIKQLNMHTEAVDFGKAIERLRNNKDFIKVFIEGYFKEDTLRQASLLATPSEIGNRGHIFEEMAAKSHCMRFLQLWESKGFHSQETILELEEMKMTGEVPSLDEI